MKNMNSDNLCNKILSNYDEIKTEILNYIKTDKLHRHPEKIVDDNKQLFENGKWDGVPFSKMDPQYHPEEIINKYLFIVKERCPITFSIFEKYKDILANASLNILSPGIIVNPHTEASDKYMRFQIGISVDPNCFLEMNGREYIWETNKFLSFRDTQLHSAKHEGTRDLVMLSFDVDLTFVNN